MPQTLPRWRLRPSDLAIILGTWALVGDIWLKLHLGPAPYLLASAIWGGGLILSELYRRDTPASFTTLVVDHVLFSAGWFGALRLFNRPVDFLTLLSFMPIALAGVLFTRVVPWQTPQIHRQQLTPFLPGPVAIVPRTLFAGVIAGVAVMCLFGRWAARENYHREFTRTTPWMAPSTNYYPTASELANIVRHQAKPGTVLVIVGGNSVFYGLGQPPGRVWTTYLQRELGSGYSVVNLALPGAAITDGGAVIAEILRDEYPRQVYLANVWACQSPEPGGSLAYRYIFWDARYKGLLIDDPARNEAMNRAFALPGLGAGITELQCRMLLDRLLYFQDGWNYLTYRKFGTVWGHYPLGDIWGKPRDGYPDVEADFLTIPAARRFAGNFDATDLSIVRNQSELAFEPGDAGSPTWKAKPAMWQKFKDSIDPLFPGVLKKRTLIVVSRNCPYFIEKLSPVEQERDELAHLMTVQKWRESGYEAMDYGSGFVIEDYGDRVHLTSLGGAKLAKLVAVKVREMSHQLGYTNP